MANTYLTHSASAGNRKKWTWSGWVKRASSSSGSGQYLMACNSIPNYYSTVNFTGDNLRYYDYYGGFEAQLITNRVFKDFFAYYHIVVTYDSAQATASDRVKIYVNGVQETSFSTSTYPSQNADSYQNVSGYTQKIGVEDNSAYFDGIMSHVHFCDGYAYAPSDFGSTDSTTGEWKINTSPSVSYGTNGYFLFKDDNSVTDRSGQSNNFTVSGGTLIKSEDCASNVFCNINPLDNYIANATLTNGNTTVATGSGNPSWNYITSTLGVNTGKYYWEVKDTTNNSSILGFASKLTTASGDQLGESTAQWGVQSNGRFRSAGSDLATTGTFSFGQNDIVGFALDCDNNKIYVSVNGTYGNSGNPSTGANGITITSPDASGGTGFYFPAFGDGNTTSDTYHVNFGNGYFGTTAVSSAGTNASGNGIFEFDCPQGYTALSTKGLNE